ncbi:hypothetical protein XIS1_1030018 [Xenorhabdus innexi]|uniref:Uncharacterized protein n=1 Tax=Xenorhabdus innexi TaxID=290109 RepID=A0A1N6MQ71_9GAMM|nr:hypothetical protein XIS1_1030018 [Xenorhabdus innexi]
MKVPKNENLCKNNQNKVKEYIKFNVIYSTDSSQHRNRKSEDTWAHR